MATLTDDRRVRFLRAALECFARYGYRRTSMEAIAQAADVSRPALYQYYRGKEEVFRATSEWALDGLAQRAETRAAAADGSAERLLAVLLVVCRMYDVDGEPGEFRTELIDEAYARAADIWHRFEQRLISLLTSILREAGNLGETGIDTTETAALLLYSAKGVAMHVADRAEQRRLVGGLVAMTIR